MNSSDETPKLPIWVFLATDGVLILAALAIAVWSAHPLATSAILWIVACVVLGAVVALLPLVARYERQKNAALDERQRELEALAATVAASADQLSIAASGLHQIADLAAKNVRLAEHLPQKLQEKMAEFQALLASGADTEKEELERELLALRTSESERLDSVSQRIAALSAEWAKLEAATHGHLTAANEAVAKLAFGTASAIGKAQAAAEQALGHARVEAARVVGEAGGHAAQSIESAKLAALEAFEARLAGATSVLVARVVQELDATLARRDRPFADTTGGPDKAAAPASGEAPRPDSGVGTDARSPAVTAAAEANTPGVKRVRKLRREDSAAVEPAPRDSSVPVSSPEAVLATAPVFPGDSDSADPILPDEPAPVPVSKIEEIMPVAPDTAEPFADSMASTPYDSLRPDAPARTPEGSPAADFERTGRKRSPKKPENDEGPGLGLELEDRGATPALAAPAPSPDGITRLLVTSYIGIGNRLFIRGSGPGLSWEKGLPLQFVSIGKWRWETPDASAPVHFKLYKNDDVECAALGEQSVQPGYQQEVSAAF